MRFFVVFSILIAISVKIFDCTPESPTLGRIVRGHDAKLRTAAYFVKLDLKRATDFYMCGAALIDVRWLLTAAHCFQGTLLVIVNLGWIANKLAERIYYVPLSDIRVHPDFDVNFGANDIALVKIPRTVLSKRVAIVPLPRRSTTTTSRYRQANAILCGWGKTSTHAARFPSRLQCGRLQVLNRKSCRSPYINETTRNIICTAVSSHLASPCFGDSGGPLLLEKTGELIGITSIGNTVCEDSAYTAVFTAVASYLDWIKKISGVGY